MAEIRARLRLQCAYCRWLPEEDKTVATIEEHFRKDHPEALSYTMNLAPFCTCGIAMDIVRTGKTGGGFIDHFGCPQDGNTTKVKRGS